MDSPSGPGPLLRRLQLLLPAWRLHGVALRLGRHEPLPTTQAAMLGEGSLPAGAAPEDAVWAAGWVARVRGGVLGQLDTCLVRSMVAATLVADAPGVAVRVGVFRPDVGADLLDAHAWLTVAEREVPPSAEDAGCRFEEVLVLPMERA